MTAVATTLVLPLFCVICGSLGQALRVTLLRTLVPRYRFANATAALTAVAHGETPYSPFPKGDLRKRASYGRR
ncbi:MAG: hypothetical protein V7K88_02515 [Nostoc sp.]|uniref:hypothetical protein n=1 Tax=Nostoc sp. TaxID=1180 RepID=UPI002FF6FC8F